MGTATRPTGQVLKQSSAAFMARIDDHDGSYLTRADVASIAYTIYEWQASKPDDRSTTVTGHSAVALTVSSVVYDTLQDDTAWSKDNTGYNFRFVPSNVTNKPFSTASKDYLVRVELTMADGSMIPLEWLVHCR